MKTVTQHICIYIKISALFIDLFKNLFKNFACVCVCLSALCACVRVWCYLCMYMQVSTYVQRPEEDVRCLVISLSTLFL